MLLFLKKIFYNQLRDTVRDDRKRVLIVRLDVIGDFILWIDAAKELRCLFPQRDYSITLVGNSIWTSLAKNLDYFDEVWPLDRQALIKSSFKFVRFVRKLSSVCFDTVLHPVYSREFLFGDFFVWACTAQAKIGMEGDNLNESRWQKRLGDRFYTRLILCPNNTQTELERNAVFMRAIGLSDFRAGTSALALPSETHLILPYTDYYVVVPGASVAARRWPVANFASLIEKTQAMSGLPAVVCGGPTEKALGETLEETTSSPVLNLVGKTSLSELVSIIAGARFLIGNETGAVHIAAAVRTPSVCILGGGHFGRFIPYCPGTADVRRLLSPVFRKMVCFGCNWQCIYKTPFDEAVPCIRNISVDEVLAAVLESFKLKEA